MFETESVRSPRPLVKWAGGKRGLLQELATRLPPDVGPGFKGTFWEPFVGGAAFFLWLNPRKAVLADINIDLVNLYRAVRNKPDELMARLDELQELPHNADVYYDVRSQHPQDRDYVREGSAEPAARLIYLNRNCFNGLYRVNQRGEFNVPFGRYKRKPTLYDEANLRAVSRRLSAAVAPHDLRCESFESVLLGVKAGDFVYLDPPYHPLNATSHFTSYAAGKFGLADQRRLRDSIVETHLRTKGRARLMLSNSTAPELVSLYREVNDLVRIETITASRAISAKSSGRGQVDEIVVMNY